MLAVDAGYYGLADLHAKRDGKMTALSGAESAILGDAESAQLAEWLAPLGLDAWELLAASAIPKILRSHTLPSSRHRRYAQGSRDGWGAAVWQRQAGGKRHCVLVCRSAQGWTPAPANATTPAPADAKLYKCSGTTCVADASGINLAQCQQLCHAPPTPP
eukprot:gene2074-19597_t